MSNPIGSPEPGKLADIIRVRMSAPERRPCFNIYAHLVYALKASDVTDLMVNGKMLVRNRASLTLNTSTILAKAEEYRKKIGTSLVK